MTERRREHPNTYIVQDHSSGEEMRRLALQDSMLTEAMGGVLPEQDNPERFRTVLDVGCGTGGWLIEVAKRYPTITELVGIDVSRKMVDYATEQAKQAGVADRVTFRVMDATLVIEFPKNSFDLINQRLNFSHLRTWDWPLILQRYQYSTKRGGTIRVTEPAFFTETTSPALNTLYALGLDAFWRAGHLFSPGSNGVIDALPGLFHQQGIADVQTRLITTDYSTSSTFKEDNRLIFRTIKPFIHKWCRLPPDYDNLYTQAMIEMEAPGFHAESQLLTVWGMNKQQNDKLPPIAMDTPS